MEFELACDVTHTFVSSSPGIWLKELTSVHKPADPVAKIKTKTSGHRRSSSDSSNSSWVTQSDTTSNSDQQVVITQPPQSPSQARSEIDLGGPESTKGAEKPNQLEDDEQAQEQTGVDLQGVFFGEVFSFLPREE
jgi:hypothetical protein